MGNPAGVRRKKKEKRRAKFETRLGGPLAYIPKDAREEAIKAIEAEEKKMAAEAKAKKK
jgi:hypothetical protein